MTTVVAPPAFVHDLNTCVGCQACAIACINENQLEPGHFWRHIVTFNPARHPAVPTFHLSLACNHCLDAPCLRYCPALAIRRDDRTGSVLIDDDRCIGCRYCSWVCPYDAPRWNARRSVMQKCTLCAHRLHDGLQPACVTLCPTGALRLGAFEADDTSVPHVDGFPRAAIGPAIRFIPLKRHAPGSTPEPQAPAATAPSLAAEAPAPKVTLRSEWTLATFTFVAIVLVAWLAASRLGGPPLRATPFVVAGLAGMGLSTLHLGRKARAWRAVLNWRRSWLSREVLTFPAFLALAVVSLQVAAGAAWLPWAALVSGVACLVSMDRVYAVMARDPRSLLDDLNATSSALFLAGGLASMPLVFVPAGLLRLAQFGSRQRMLRQRLPWRRLLGPGRVLVGFLLPWLAWWAGGITWQPAAAAAIVLGEALDRVDFYATLDVVTPRQEMARALPARLSVIGDVRPAFTATRS